MRKNVTRREMISTTAALGALSVLGPRRGAGAEEIRPIHSSGRLKQSASRWCYGKIPLPDLCVAGKQIGLSGIDLLQKADWQVVRDHGLTVSMGYTNDRPDFLTNGFVNRASHPMLIRELEVALPIAKAAGVPNLIAMFGNREGRSDAVAIPAAIDGLKQIAPLAEEQGVTVCVELLNSKVDHKDYAGDHTAFGVQVMSAINSPRVKLLYDIYHMQIMEGDVIRTIRDNHQYIAHYHTGGVPGRHELDDSQELNWHGIMRAIADTGFSGFVAHEFVPTRDPLTSLREAFQTCDV
ncbi:MAG: hydroxypyruvate isomerase family protein [Gemmatimonadaceae bacterium]